MCKLTILNKWWFISKNGKTVLFGVGKPAQALAIAKANDMVLTEFEDQSDKRAA